jgi:hypothetical protein
VQWQCPQGGYDKSADKGCKVTGVWREVWEEIGLTPDHGLQLVDQLKEELKYEIDGGAHKGYGTSSTPTTCIRTTAHAQLTLCL